MLPNIIIPSDSSLFRTLHRLAGTLRMIFFVGLPGVGKSLLLNQQAHMAHALGRAAHIIQWDVCRQPFDADAQVRAAYPEVNGVTHAAIRKATGLWARDAVIRWRQEYADPEHLLIGEVPLIGGRLMELVRPQDDAAEPLLSGLETCFMIAVPSREVRRHIESRREENSANPRHEREQADAPPDIMRASWTELHQAAGRLGICADKASDGNPPYDPDIYHDAYAALLKYRRHERLAIAIRLSADRFSAYDLEIHRSELTPTPDEVRRYMGEVERRYPDMGTIEMEVKRWYDIDD